MIVKRKGIILLLIIMLLVALSGLIPYGKALTVEYENSNRLLAYMPIEDQQRFQIRYTHSVHRTLVVEIYQIDNEQIVQVELIYENFAIGMPSNAHGEETFNHKDGKYFISNMHRVFNKIDLRTGQVIANHTLIVDGVQKPFREFVEPGTWARLEVASLSFWQRLRGDEITWKKKD
ncbi:DUF1850 domain-containing protein [Pseudalkalibacillus decolorationis]|uniref:DUF1850 domain-containing protein n=1 Tax=Pseudalkalibacillus decolorationis TaxID=163879 RepID=UPI00214834F8|nr:DUF1850 domain-containing protein [Pseudalkalibacillus decolorationis]